MLATRAVRATKLDRRHLYVRGAALSHRLKSPRRSEESDS